MVETVCHLALLLDSLRCDIISSSLSQTETLCGWFSSETWFGGQKSLQIAICLMWVSFVGVEFLPVLPLWASHNDHCVVLLTQNSKYSQINNWIHQKQQTSQISNMIYTHHDEKLINWLADDHLITLNNSQIGQTKQLPHFQN